MTPFQRYGATLRLIKDGIDTITGVTERTGAPRATVETHFRSLRERGLIVGGRYNRNQAAVYSLTNKGHKWLELAESLEADGGEERPEKPPAVVGIQDHGSTAELYLWLRLSPPVPHSVKGRVHRLSWDEKSPGEA